MNCDKQVGKVIRVEYDEESGDVRIVIDITDPIFKDKVIYNRDFKYILTIRGKDAIIMEE